MNDSTENTVALVTEDMLMAYVDGALDGRQRLLVEHYLAASPEAAERVAAYMEQNRALRDLFDGHLAEPLPPEIAAATERLRRATQPELERGRGAGGFANGRRGMAAIAASIVVAALVAGAVVQLQPHWFGDRQAATPQSSGETLLGQGGLMPAGGAIEGAALTNSGGPDLSRYGFALTNERRLGMAKAGLVDSGADTRQFTYQDESGHWMALYAGPAAGSVETPVMAMYGAGRTILAWQAGGVSYSLIGSLSQDKLTAIARHIGGAPAVKSIPGGDAKPGVRSLKDDSAQLDGTLSKPLVDGKIIRPVIPPSTAPTLDGKPAKLPERTSTLPSVERQNQAA
ncbi:anti-sigma factor family protein [Oceanibaculum pacificum]|uniref:Anti-sigma factor n=1 Tax=Oceanibaculum pacificum TaxID=580166 RepID=A0A154VPS5_9PROT|nr:hypothetical protein [Oceanibaculum pacificum]KZD03357.1 hypothetical protein AUP43_13190 [Oceanibaculum pacificum]